MRKNPREVSKPRAAGVASMLERPVRCKALKPRFKMELEVARGTRGAVTTFCFSFDRFDTEWAENQGAESLREAAILCCCCDFWRFLTNSIQFRMFMQTPNYPFFDFWANWNLHLNPGQSEHLIRPHVTCACGSRAHVVVVDSHSEPCAE